MTTLIFIHKGYTVATSAWSACDNSDEVDLVYLWSEWASSHAGHERLTLKITVAEFCNRLAGGSVVDLRSVETKA